MTYGCEPPFILHSVILSVGENYTIQWGGKNTHWNHSLLVISTHPLCPCYSTKFCKYMFKILSLINYHNDFLKHLKLTTLEAGFLKTYYDCFLSWCKWANSAVVAFEFSSFWSVNLNLLICKLYIILHIQ